jgi:Protein of unknown function (DUF2934)
MQNDPASSGAPGREDIARHAYDLWLAAGSPINTGQDHWLQAERELFSAPARDWSVAPTGVAESTTPNSASGSSSVSGQGATSSGSGRGGR